MIREHAASFQIHLSILVELFDGAGKTLISDEKCGIRLAGVIRFSFFFKVAS